MTTLKQITRTIKKKTQRAATYLDSHKMQVFMLALILMPVCSASAAEAKWNGVIQFIVPWIEKLGGALALWGGVDVGLGFKNDDAEGKTKGWRLLISGFIVIAVALSSGTFLYS